MKKVKCPKCKNKIALNQRHESFLLRKGETIVSCPRCNYFFNYKKRNPYKRPLKFLFFSLLRIGMPLKDFDKKPIYSDYVYVSLKHCVTKRVCIPNGPQGFVEISVPKQIATKEELVDYLKKYETNH